MSVPRTEYISELRRTLMEMTSKTTLAFLLRKRKRDYRETEHHPGRGFLLPSASFPLRSAPWDMGHACINCGRGISAAFLGLSEPLCVYCSAIHLPDKLGYFRLSSKGTRSKLVRVFSCISCSCTIEMYAAECPQPKSF